MKPKNLNKPSSKSLGSGLKPRSEFSEKVLTIVDNIFLYERYDTQIKPDIEKIKKVMLNKMIFLSGQEWDLINKEISFIQSVYENHDITIFDESFVRAYEGYVVLKEIGELLTNYKFNNEKIVTYLREGLKAEPKRKNLLGFFLLAILNGKGDKI